MKFSVLIIFNQVNEYTKLYYKVIAITYDNYTSKLKRNC